MFIRPLNDLKVRDPIMKDHLPAEGRLVTPSLYWTRRINEGAIEIVVQPAPENAAEATEKAALAKTPKGAAK